MADGSSCLVRLCARLDSFGITGLHLEAQGIGSVIVLIAGICSKMLGVNITLLWMDYKMLFYDYNLLNLQGF